MTEINRYELMMEALNELKSEMDTTRQNQVKATPARPSLNEVLAEYGHMPHGALFLGVASDELPVLLNLHDPIPGPILITADAGAGKTALLQTIALAAGQMHQPEDLQFGVLTNHPDEWSGLEAISNNVGVFPLYNRSAEDFILSLASWAHSNKNATQSVLILVDDLEAMAQRPSTSKTDETSRRAAIALLAVALGPHRIGDYAAGAQSLTAEPLPAGGTCSLTLVLGVAGSTEVQRAAAQTDALSWDVVFTLQDPPKP